VPEISLFFVVYQNKKAAPVPALLYFMNKQNKQHKDKFEKKAALLVNRHPLNKYRL